MKYNPKMFSIRSSSAAAGGCLLGLLLGISTCQVYAQSLISSANYSLSSTSPTTYEYTIRLSNSSGSSLPIQTFWYAWEPGGADYLPSEPSSFVAPPGWSGVVTG